jgi:hypothetical protein
MAVFTSRAQYLARTLGGIRWALLQLRNPLLLELARLSPVRQRSVFQ